MKAIGETTKYFQAEIEKRRAAPGDDLISYLTTVRIDGAPLGEDHLLGTLRLLLIAGIDTTWSAIGASLWHLAQHPQDRKRLAGEPDLIPTAVEEFLRAYAPVTMAREVVKDTTIDGCPFKPGQMVLLSFPAANRDPAVFPDADRVVIDRKENRHAAFGLGIHRCIGSNLARMEITVRAAGVVAAHSDSPRPGRQGDLVRGDGAWPAPVAGAVRRVARALRRLPTAARRPI
jgi:cytochrome P450